MRMITKFFLAVAVCAFGALTADAQGRGNRGGAGGGAQPPGGGRQGGGMMGGMGGQTGYTQLVTNKGVIEELKITDEQKETLAKWSTETATKTREKMTELFPRPAQGEQPDPTQMQERMKKMAEFNATAQKEQLADLGKVLKPEQLTRIKQIMVQVQGVAVFNSKDTQDALKLTDDQKDTIKEINASMNEERREMMQGLFGGGNGERPDQAEMQKRMAENQKKMSDLSKKYIEKIKNQLKDDQKKTYEEMVGKAFDYKPEMPQRRRDN